MNAPEPTPTDGKLPVVFDLDGTLAEATWPSNHVGNPIQDGIELMLEYSSRGYAILIHSARPVSHEARIWRWLEDLGLQNVVFNVVCGKPLGCLYVDDRAFRPDYVDQLEAEERMEAVASPVAKSEAKKKTAPTTVIDDDDQKWEPDSEGDAHPADWEDPSAWTPVG